MKPFVVSVGVVLATLGVPSRPVAASWVTSTCFGGSSSDSNVKRADAQAYSTVAEMEGYEAGGGCWNDNGRDDTPGQPDSGGEGADCSGLTFKAWEMKSTYGQSGFTWYDKLKDIHGPYHASDLHGVGQSSSLPFYKLANKDRGTTLYMDAFAASGHDGMLYTSSNPGSNTDWIIESLNDDAGMDLNIQGYRYDSSYIAVRRKAWTPDCFPNCSFKAAFPLVTIR